MANESTIKELEEIREDLLEKLRKVEITIETLKTMNISGSVYGSSHVSGNLTASASDVRSTSISDKIKKFPPNTSFRKKVALVIKAEERFLHAREIAEIIFSIDGGSSAEDITKKVSPALSSLGQKGTITKIKIGASNINSFWGSKNWLEANGEVKPGHEYNKKYLVLAGDKIEI